MTACRAYSSITWTSTSRVATLPSPCGTSWPRLSSARAFSHSSAWAISAFQVAKASCTTPGSATAPLKSQSASSSLVQPCPASPALQHALEPVILHLGQVTDQAEQAQAAGRDRAPVELAGVQRLALHLDGQPVIAEVLPVGRLFADGIALRAGVILGGGPHVAHKPTQSHGGAPGKTVCSGPPRPERPTTRGAARARRCPLFGYENSALNRCEEWPRRGTNSASAPEAQS